MHPEIICLGEPLVEFNHQADGTFLQGVGGDVSNVAIAAARNGASVGLSTNIGNDFFGHHLLQFWKATGVDTTGVNILENEDTGVYFVTHDANGHHFTYRRKGSAASKFSENDLRFRLIETCQVLYASGITLAVSPSLRKAAFRAIERGKRSGKTVAFDPNLRTALWPLEEARSVTHEAMKLCDIALPGLDDARILTGLDDPMDIVAFYHDLGAEIVALTLGRDGVLLSQPGHYQFIPGRAVNAVDATGAGDCFNGVFLSTYTANRNALSAAVTANEEAAASTTKYGAV